ncbi:unnamed protein product [Pseudo-nitzschia multistriata]|uniref:Uncharacterized protein n=1 Tax=Pseudo-nitzschia multistriata TaxID=183589 RepID=A0A448Z185_9STRA|nr:unnamed protein product [Pseudo-nitzschia multistriata]
MASTGFIAARSANLMSFVTERYSCGEILSNVNPSLWKAYPTVAIMADRPCLSSAARMNFPVSADPHFMVRRSHSVSPRKNDFPPRKGDSPTRGTFWLTTGAGAAASSSTGASSTSASASASSLMRKAL